jgi:hypothetical protein
MASQDKGLPAEIERRAAEYDAHGEGGAGRLTWLDYLGMAALAVGLTLAFWASAV